MARSVFWSWQSDRPARETRSLIREALVKAIDRIAVEFDEAGRPEIDHDTRGAAGSPDIVATILTKIDRAGVFVADVTPIAISENGKHIANPNVLIELGYAKRALGTERVITVWNTAFTDARPEDLPFDMRHRRGPITFNLPRGAPAADLRKIRDQLTDRLEEAIRACLSTIPVQPSLPPPWQPHFELMPSAWIEGAEPLVVNRGYDGTSRIGMDSLPRGYARLIPATWKAKPDALTILDAATTHPIPLGRYSGLNWGPTRGGFLAYRASDAIEQRNSTPTSTRWFRQTGELWGVASSFFSESDDKRFLSTTYAVERWIAWLTHNVKVCRAVGGEGPFFVRLGLDGMDGSRWPTQRFLHHAELEALESNIEHIGVLRSGDDNEIRQLVSEVFAITLSAYGLPALPEGEFDRMVAH